MHLEMNEWTVYKFKGLGYSLDFAELKNRYKSKEGKVQFENIDL